MEVAPVWTSMYHYAWFISFAVSMIVYLALMKAVSLRGVG